MHCSEIPLTVGMFLVYLTLDARRQYTIRRWMAVLLICFLSQTIHGGAPNNRGKEFIIGFMENRLSSKGIFDVDVFVATTRTKPVNVNLTTPRYSSSINEQFSIKAGEVKKVSISPAIQLNGNSKVANAVHVMADDDVVVYAVNKEWASADAYLALPVDVLGNEHYAVTYYPPSRHCELMIIGVEDGTTVTIRFPAYMQNPVTWNNESYGAGSTLTGTVDRFDLWQLISLGDLTGTYITSDKKIGVISGNKKVKIRFDAYSSDHLCEMMVPVHSWGKNFISVPIPERTVGDIFRFIASEAGTTITIFCGHNDTITLSNEGDYFERHIASTAYCSIKADKAIMVTQFVLSEQSEDEISDPSMMLLPPIEQFAEDYTFDAPKLTYIPKPDEPPATTDHFFMFVIRHDNKDGLKVNGNPFPASTVYHQVIHNGIKYAAGYIKITEGANSVRHDSPIKVFGGYLYGRIKSQTYAFPTGTRLSPINKPCTPTTSDIGDGLDNDCDGLIDEEACWDSNHDDDGDLKQDEDCATPPPVDGQWADWNHWGPCSVTCFSITGVGNNGSRSRERTCTNPAPAYDGKQCVGQASETESCSATNVFCPAENNTKSCKEILNMYPSTQGKDGVYHISFGSHEKPVFCDMTTDGGGWTVIQKRQDGSTDFFQSWVDYKKGFGSASFDYWIGNDVIHSLTNETNHKLRVEVSSGCEDAYAMYSSFRVGDESRGYKLIVTGYSGTAGDNFRRDNGMKFSTYDRDNDKDPKHNCAKERHGGWWYKKCDDSSLNGEYGGSAEIGPNYMTWWTWKQKYVSLKSSIMKIRPYTRPYRG